ARRLAKWVLGAVDRHAGDRAAVHRLEATPDRLQGATVQLVAADEPFLLLATERPPRWDVDHEADEREVCAADRPAVGVDDPVVPPDNDHASAILASDVRKPIVEVEPAPPVVPPRALEDARDLERRVAALVVEQLLRLDDRALDGERRRRRELHREVEVPPRRQERRRRGWRLQRAVKSGG